MEIILIDKIKMYNVSINFILFYNFKRILIVIRILFYIDKYLVIDFLLFFEEVLIIDLVNWCGVGRFWRIEVVSRIIIYRGR